MKPADRIRKLIDSRAAADAIDGKVNHLDDPDGACAKGLVHKGACKR